MGGVMTDEVVEEESNTSEDESVPEMTIEERQDALKKARWNVFLYLGLAAILFGFALYPFMSTSLSVDEGIGSTDYTVNVWGLPVAGEDFTDIPVEIEVIVQALPTDVESIEVFMIENPKGCDAIDGSIGQSRVDLQKGESEHPNQYYSIDNPVESQTYDVEFGVDPGIYCLQIVVNSGGDTDGINVQSEVNIYPTQFPLAIIATMSLLMSAFAFIGAQKHGKFVKSLIEPKAEPTVEETVLSETSTARIIAGPSGPPTGPTGPPGAGLTGPPTDGPSGPPVSQPTSEPVPETEPVAEAAPEELPVADVYEDQGDGWFFRKFPDGSYDQTVYVVEDGQYVPYENPDA